jgi:hypothetical protein
VFNVVNGRDIDAVRTASQYFREITNVGNYIKRAKEENAGLG